MAQSPRATLGWKPLLADWYENKPDSVTHSAAGLAIRKLGHELPVIEQTKNPKNGRSWHVNSLGVTMLRVQAGTFDRQTWIEDPEDFEKVIERTQTVVLSRPFLLSDREIPIGLFQQFIDDPDYAAAEKPGGACL